MTTDTNPPDDLAAVESCARASLDAAKTAAELRAAESAVLGKRSPLARLHTRLRDLHPDQRRAAGAEINDARARVSTLAKRRLLDLEAADRARLDAEERLDLTEVAAVGSPGASLGVPDRGRLHLVTQVRDELEDTFVSMGFTVSEGSEAETDWYNFEALNMPPDHPARGMWDTLYLRVGPPGTVLLRTHTSPVQIRLMQAQSPPIYAVMPGRCYRRDTPDARHLPVFHQIDGLVVDRGITFGDLAGTIEAFTNAFFGAGIRSRLRPSFFPFTEPSAEFDVTCPICAGAGCRTSSPRG